MRSYTGKPLYAVWRLENSDIRIAAMTRKEALEYIIEIYEYNENEYTEEDLKRIKQLWSTKEGIIK